MSVSEHLAFSAHVHEDSSSRVAAEAAPGLQECTNLLADSALYYLDLDVADQRAALIGFYDSTGGQYWANQPADDPEHVLFPQIVEGVVEAGNGLTSGTLDVSALPVELVSDAASLASISANSAMQQYLSLGQQWLKYSWGSNVSYCYWSGVTCCQTVQPPSCNSPFSLDSNDLPACIKLQLLRLRLQTRSHSPQAVDLTAVTAALQ